MKSRTKANILLYTEVGAPPFGRNLANLGTSNLSWPEPNKAKLSWALVYLNNCNENEHWQQTNLYFEMNVGEAHVACAFRVFKHWSPGKHQAHADFPDSRKWMSKRKHEGKHFPSTFQKQPFQERLTPWFQDMLLHRCYQTTADHMYKPCSRAAFLQRNQAIIRNQGLVRDLPTSNLDVESESCLSAFLCLQERKKRNHILHADFFRADK